MAENKEPIGTVPVNYMGKALFFTMDGGTFTDEGIEGLFTTTVGGTSVIVYIGDVAYQCLTEDIVNAAVAHFKTLPPEVQAKARPKPKKPDGE